jgi:hypothetical protein
MGCSTEECGLRKKAEYKVEVQLAVVATDTSIASDPINYRHLYGWDAPPDWLSLGHGNNKNAKELQPTPQRQTLRVGAGVDPVPVMTRLSMHLFQWNTKVKKTDQHMVAWRSFIDTSYDYDSEVEITADLLFKNWVPNMRDYQFFAYEDIGAANVQTDIRILSFPQDYATPARWDAQHNWQGQEAPAFGEDAVTSTKPGSSPL